MNHIRSWSTPSAMNRFTTLLLAATLALGALPARSEVALASWTDSASRNALVDFVNRVTDENGDDFVPQEARIAVFDNDGTLWAEKPVYFQLLYAVDEARAQLARHPELAEESPYREIAGGDLAAIAKLDRESLLKLVLGTHTERSESSFQDSVQRWLASATHPTTELPYTGMVYQPMLELLAYLRAHGFQTWIVSGGGVGFIRAFAEPVYGIPPEQVVGSRVGLAYRDSGDAPEIVREAKITHVNDGPGKPVGIQQAIGRRPILAVGNSDGDYEMLAWTTAGEGPGLGVIVRHTDGEREWEYDRESSVGHLDRALDDAAKREWVIIDMARDWSRVF